MLLHSPKKKLRQLGRGTYRLSDIKMDHKPGNLCKRVYTILIFWKIERHGYIPPPMPILVPLSAQNAQLNEGILETRFSESTLRIYVVPQALNVNEFQLNVHQFESLSIWLSNTMALEVREWWRTNQRNTQCKKNILSFYCDWFDKFEWYTHTHK